MTDQVCYRIYVERPAREEELTDRVGRYFQNYTLVTTYGYWKGGREHSVVIEIIGTLGILQQVTDLTGDLKVGLKQEAVLVTWHPIQSMLI